jgi:hypothetical protein
MGRNSQYADRRSLLYENEMMLPRALAAMEMEGQVVDAGYMWQLGLDLEEELEQRGAELNRTFREKIDWGNDTALRHFLYDYLKLPIVKWTQGSTDSRVGGVDRNKQPSIDRDALLSLRDRCPPIEQIAEYRSVLKAVQSCSVSIAWEVQADGKIHPSFNQNGTASGRLSSERPNFQNIVARHKVLSPKIRAGWKVQPGRARIYADYSQIELRVLAFYTKCQTFLNAYRSPSYDAYRSGRISYDDYRWYRRSEKEVDVHGDVARRIFPGMDKGHRRSQTSVCPTAAVKDCSPAIRSSAWSAVTRKTSCTGSTARTPRSTLRETISSRRCSRDVFRCSRIGRGATFTAHGSDIPIETSARKRSDLLSLVSFRGAQAS